MNKYIVILIIVLNIFSAKGQEILTITPDLSIRTFTRDDFSAHLDSRTDGIRLVFASEGYILSEIHIKNGKRNGPVRVYHSNGIPKILGQYLEGERNKRFYYWNEEGRLVKYEDYEDGKLVDQQVFIPADSTPTKNE